MEGDSLKTNMPPQLSIMQSLWIGPRLSTMERLSINSFLAHGHEFHLHVYDEMEGVPAGAMLKDANDILPASEIFRHGPHGTYAPFADRFRYRLLLERGGWWVDTDTVCLRPFDFPADIVISSERGAGGCRFVNNGMLKFPAGSAVMETACRICEVKDLRSISPCEIGPELMEWLVAKFSLQPFVQEPEVFCPVPWDPARELTAPGGSLPKDAYAVHLWNDAWADAGIDKDAEYPEDSLYELLKSKYLRA
jgi:hypothetical protein